MEIQETDDPTNPDISRQKEIGTETIILDNLLQDGIIYSLRILRSMH